jgi:GH25 family lysozyme M1 (1,4-beta-N-acetylmuramidase)
MIKGIDISRWNDVKDFNQVKKEGYDFVIIRAGGNNGGFYKDPKFEAYYEGAKSAGLYVGAYYDTGRDFISEPVGYACSTHFKTLLQGKQFEFPVYADVETVATAYKHDTTKCVTAFCRDLERSGYFAGIYGSDISGFYDRMDLNKLKGIFSLWVARYGTKPEIVKDFAMWQHSSRGIVKGISGFVDLDKCYVDFPSIIKNLHFNNF